MEVNAKNPAFSAADHSAIDIDLLHPVFGWMPFTARRDDVEQYGRDLFELAAAGAFGEVAPYVAPPPAYPEFTALQMLNKFSESEQLAIVQAAMTNAAVKLWYDRLMASSRITYEDAGLANGLQLLVDNGLLTAQRKADIAAAMQPA